MQPVSHATVNGESRSVRAPEECRKCGKGQWDIWTSLGTWLLLGRTNVCVATAYREGNDATHEIRHNNWS